jgi:hypothetical protein
MSPAEVLAPRGRKRKDGEMFTGGRWQPLGISESRS